MFDECRDLGHAPPMSGWLRAAILENIHRDPLLAAEDAIMLVDIVKILSRKIMTAEQILSNPLIGGWPKKAIADIIGRPIEDGLRDVEFLRDMLAANLFECHWSGKLAGPDVNMRVRNVIMMINGIGKEAVAKWSRHAAQHLKVLSESPDGGLAEIQDCRDAERDAGHDEMADIIEQMSRLGEDELREQLLAMCQLFAKGDPVH